MLPDLKKPTFNQRKNLLRIIHYAFVEIRLLAWQGKSQQAYDLADAFHNLPVYIESDDFSFQSDDFSFLIDFVKAYHQKYSETTFNYSDMLNKIVRDENLDGYND